MASAEESVVQAEALASVEELDPGVVRMLVREAEALQRGQGAEDGRFDDNDDEGEDGGGGAGEAFVPERRRKRLERAAAADEELVEDDDAEWEDQDQDWDEWGDKEELDEFEQTKSLLSDAVLASPTEVLAELKAHNPALDLAAVRDERGLDFYACVRLVNYLRQQPAAALASLKLPASDAADSFWSDDELLIPVLAGDPLIGFVAAGGDDEDN